MKVKVTQSYPTLFDPMDYTVHGLLQARILEWVAFPFFRGSFQSRDRTQVSCIVGRFFTSCTTWAEKAMAPHSSTLAWKTPRMEEPGRLQSMGSLSWTRLSNFTFTFHFHALEKEMETHSSVLAWRIPGTGEPGGLQSMGSHRVGHDWSDLAAAAAALPGKPYHFLESSFFIFIFFTINDHLLIFLEAWGALYKQLGA